jgi:hypothetical protein
MRMRLILLPSWACLAVPYFAHIISWSERFSWGKNYWTQNLWFDNLYKFFWNISNSKKNTARYYNKCSSVFMYNIRYCYRILIKLEFFRLFFVIFSNVEFHENPSTWNKVVPRGQRDIQTKRQTDGITYGKSDIKTLLVAFCNFAN